MITLTSPKGHKINYALKFAFKATNNVAKIEALLANLWLAKEMHVQRIEVERQLVVIRLKKSLSPRIK